MAGLNWATESSRKLNPRGEPFGLMGVVLVRRKMAGRPARAALVLLLTAMTAKVALAGGPFTFSSTGSLATARHSPNAVLLSNGTVLVAGGVGDSFSTSAEVYNPATGTWKSTGSMTTLRAFSTATLLRDGRVLMAGGGSAGSVTAELYDPISGTWTATGSMSVSRRQHTATLLRNGKVLVCGGSDSNGNNLAKAEFDRPGDRQLE